MGMLEAIRMKNGVYLSRDREYLVHSWLTVEIESVILY